MEGLTAKVFRTYNASITLQQQLKELTNRKSCPCSSHPALQTWLNFLSACLVAVLLVWECWNAWCWDSAELICEHTTVCLIGYAWPLPNLHLLTVKCHRWQAISVNSPMVLGCSFTDTLRTASLHFNKCTKWTRWRKLPWAVLCYWAWLCFLYLLRDKCCLCWSWES